MRITERTIEQINYEQDCECEISRGDTFEAGPRVRRIDLLISFHYRFRFDVHFSFFEFKEKVKLEVSS